MSSQIGTQGGGKVWQKWNFNIDKIDLRDLTAAIDQYHHLDMEFTFQLLTYSVITITGTQQSQQFDSEKMTNFSSHLHVYYYLYEES